MNTHRWPLIVLNTIFGTVFFGGLFVLVYFLDELINGAGM